MSEIYPCEQEADRGKESSSRIGMNTSDSGLPEAYTRCGVEMTPGLVYKLTRMTF